MRTVLFAIGMMLVGGIAAAQPSMTPSSESPSDEGPPPPPPPLPAIVAPGMTPTYTFPARHVLITEDERDLLEQGEMRHGQYIAGGIVASVVGYGIGHTVEGRWREIGWVFTVGEAAAEVAFMTGFVEMVSDSR